MGCKSLLASFATVSSAARVFSYTPGPPGNARPASPLRAVCWPAIRTPSRIQPPLPLAMTQVSPPSAQLSELVRDSAWARNLKTRTGAWAAAHNRRGHYATCHSALNSGMPSGQEAKDEPHGRTRPIIRGDRTGADRTTAAVVSSTTYHSSGCSMSPYTSVFVGSSEPNLTQFLHNSTLQF
jgi:hypothetical protein